MIFEGFEVNYAHIKLIPIIGTGSEDDSVEAQPIVHQVTAFYENYQGYVNSLDGARIGDFRSLQSDATAIRYITTGGGTLSNPRIRPPRTWNSPSRHLSAVIEHPWYEKLFLAQDKLLHDSISFFRTVLRYKYGFVPLTTDAVSSPQGLGSNSCPVLISLFGKDTYLADSMQFALEDLLRIQSGVPGVYYVSTSFRGEDPDKMHLNQFNHIECELVGDLDRGIEVAECFIGNLVSSFLHEQNDLIKSTAENTDHLATLLEQKCLGGGKVPRISLDSALALPCIDRSCWEPVTPDPTGARTLTRAGEQALIRYFDGGAVWLTKMDHLSVPFYQAFTDATQTKARCANLLLGNGEVLGLGERHAAAEDLKAALAMHHIPAEKYARYLQIRKQCTATTTGLGIGTERFLAWVFQHDDIRDMALLPRMQGISLQP